MRYLESISFFKLYSYLNEFIISKWDVSNVYWYELYLYKNKF